MSQDEDISTNKQKKQLSDEEWRKLLKPAPTKEQILEILQTSYTTAAPENNNNRRSVVKVIKQLDSYDDVNYMVTIDETLYLCKIHNGVESRELINVMHNSSEQAQQGVDYYYKPGHMNSAIHLQNAILSLLSSSSSSSSSNSDDIVVKTSQPIPPTTRSSTSTSSHDRPPPPPLCIHLLPVASTLHSPQDLVVRLLSWVPGRTMSSIQTLPIESLADAGRYLGKMDCILDTFNKKQDDAVDDNDNNNNIIVVDDSLWIPARRFHAWDGKNTLELRKFVHYIKDDQRRAMICSIIDTFEHDIIKSGMAVQFRRGLNHGDYNDANILVNDDGNDLTVSGVLDFGDSVER
jgi:Phosphotransferase enzyme family